MIIVGVENLSSIPGMDRALEIARGVVDTAAHLDYHIRVEIGVPDTDDELPARIEEFRTYRLGAVSRPVVAVWV